MSAPVPVMCGNEDHEPPVPASVRVSWPDGRFQPGTACPGCLEWLIGCYVTGDEDGRRHGILVEDIAARPGKEVGAAA